MNCQCNRCELGSEGHYAQWTCEYTGTMYQWTDDGVVELIRNGMYDAFCVEILSSEPTNKSAKELTEKQSYINQLSKVNQEGSETND